MNFDINPDEHTEPTKATYRCDCGEQHTFRGVGGSNFPGIVTQEEYLCPNDHRGVMYFDADDILVTSINIHR